MVYYVHYIFVAVYDVWAMDVTLITAYLFLSEDYEV